MKKFIDVFLKMLLVYYKIGIIAIIILFCILAYGFFYGVGYLFDYANYSKLINSDDFVDRFVLLPLIGVFVVSVVWLFETIIRDLYSALTSFIKKVYEKIKK